MSTLISQLHTGKVIGEDVTGEDVAFMTYFTQSHSKFSHPENNKI